MAQSIKRNHAKKLSKENHINKYLIELKNVMKCTLCAEILIGEVSVKEHLKKISHRVKAFDTDKTTIISNSFFSCDTSYGEIVHSSPTKEESKDKNTSDYSSASNCTGSSQYSTDDEAENSLILSKKSAPVIRSVSFNEPYPKNVSKTPSKISLTPIEEEISSIATSEPTNISDSGISSAPGTSCENLNVDASNSNIEYVSSSCESDIDIETVKSLVKFNTKEPRTKSNNNQNKANSEWMKNLEWTLGCPAFPDPYCRENYIKRFLRDSPENFIKCALDKLKPIQISLEFCFIEDHKIHCILCNESCVNDYLVFYEHFRSEKHLANIKKTVESVCSDEKKKWSKVNMMKSHVSQVSSNMAECICCKITLNNNKDILISHINTEEHKVKFQNSKILANEIYAKVSDVLKNLWYYIERFWCEACNLKFSHEIDFSNHLESLKHKMNITNKRMLVFDVCIPCGSLWLGYPNTYEIHNQILVHKYLLGNKEHDIGPTPMAIVHLLTRFEDHLQFLVKDSKQAKYKFQKCKFSIERSLNELLNPHYTNIKIQFSGSTTTGLCCSNSAVDIDLEIGEMNVQNICHMFLEKVEKLFLSRPDIWEVQCVMFREKIPIIHVFHLTTKLKCNISIGDKLSTKKSQTIKSFTDAYTPCKEMIIFLKKWCFLSELWSSKGITTFTITWLVIFYLQKKWIFPSILNLMQKEELLQWMHGPKSNLSEDIRRKCSSLQNLNAKVLLQGFFEFYANFDYKELVICPFLGHSVKKEVFMTGVDLPYELLINYSIKEITSAFPIEPALCLQDPLDLKRNVTGNVCKFTLREFQRHCTESAKLLLKLNKNVN